MVRTCFNQLKALAERLHEELGVNPSMRAVMEALATGGRQTVPDIAKSRAVSRQHIQTIMNALVANGLVKVFENPAHKRSPLFDLSAKDRATFAAIAQKEKEPLRRLANALSPESLKQAQEVLLRLNR
jgi:DNA-binding MarR family transcriptional regulator